MIVEDLNILKQVRKDLRDMGYKIKTTKNSLGIFFEVLDKDNHLVYGINPKGYWEKHQEVVAYLKKYESNRGVIVLR